MSNLPSEVILIRSKAYNEANPKIIYDIYDEKSEFKNLFPTLNEYRKQFLELTNIYGSIKTDIIKEKIKKNLAEVIYKDTVISNEKEITFYCKGYLKNTKNGWKIFKEIKEVYK
jgi:hypothetical protein